MRTAIFILFFCILYDNTYSQITLTSSTNNPVIGDIFYGHKCDTSGINVGASGSSVIWNFSTLIVDSTDTTKILACSATPYCDSFPTSNIVSLYNNSYSYQIANTSGLNVIGINSLGSVVHISGGQAVMYYPLSYNSTHKDSNDVNLYNVYFQHTVDSMACDGYGTLILPGADTIKNVLRVHVMTHINDSSSVFGNVHSYSENYNWFASNMHKSILSISLDTSTGKSVEYFTRNSELGVNEIKDPKSTIIAYPNPAGEELNLSFYLNDINEAQITISNILGKIVKIVDGNRLNIGINNISIPMDIPNGMYIIHLQSISDNEYKKIIIRR
jgi:type IX secretion system substrate protein